MGALHSLMLELPPLNSPGLTPSSLPNPPGSQNNHRSLHSQSCGTPSYPWLDPANTGGLSASPLSCSSHQPFSCKTPHLLEPTGLFAPILLPRRVLKALLQCQRGVICPITSTAASPWELCRDCPCCGTAGFHSTPSLPPTSGFAVGRSGATARSSKCINKESMAKASRGDLH